MNDVTLAKFILTRRNKYYCDTCKRRMLGFDPLDSVNYIKVYWPHPKKYLSTKLVSCNYPGRIR